MLKKLFNWLFAKKEAQPVREVNVFDFTKREAGHDITLRMIDDGEYAEAMVFLAIDQKSPEVGDFIVVNLELSSIEEGGDYDITFVVESVTRVALGISQLTLTRYEGAEDE